MRELVEQYKRIQGMKESLRHVRQDMPGLVTDEAIGFINDQLNAKLDSLAHQITNLIQDNPPEDTPQPERKPLWTTVPKGKPDNVWQTELGVFDSLRYRIFLTRQKAEQYAKDNDRKVVPVWGE